MASNKIKYHDKPVAIGELKPKGRWHYRVYLWKNNRDMEQGTKHLAGSRGGSFCGLAVYPQEKHKTFYLGDIHVANGDDLDINTIAHEVNHLINEAIYSRVKTGGNFDYYNELAATLSGNMVQQIYKWLETQPCKPKI